MQVRFYSFALTVAGAALFLGLAACRGVSTKPSGSGLGPGDGTKLPVHVGKRPLPGEFMPAARWQGKPFWLVGEFREGEDWLKTQPHIEKLERRWGRELTDRIRRNLEKRITRVESIYRKLTKEEVTQLVDEGLKYLCEGTLVSLTATKTDAWNSTAKLAVFYQLRKTFKEKVLVVQVKLLTFQRPVGLTIGEPDVETLLEQAAQSIASRVARDIPADMTAARG